MPARENRCLLTPFSDRCSTRTTLTQLANRRQPRYTAYSDRIIVAHLELSALLVAESGC
jgi:hypothetical protein